MTTRPARAPALWGPRETAKSSRLQVLPPKGAGAGESIHQILPVTTVGCPWRALISTQLDGDIQALGAEKALRKRSADAGSWKFDRANVHCNGEDKGTWDGMSGASAAIL